MKLMAKEGATPVIWLQGASCTGDSTSLLNTIFYTDPVGLLVTNDNASIDLNFHQTVMNASGTDLVSPARYSDSMTDVAQALLPGCCKQHTYAEWSSDTWS